MQRLQGPTSTTFGRVGRIGRRYFLPSGDFTNNDMSTVGLEGNGCTFLFKQIISKMYSWQEVGSSYHPKLRDSLEAAGYEGQFLQKVMIISWYWCWSWHWACCQNQTIFRSLAQRRERPPIGENRFLSILEKIYFPTLDKEWKIIRQFGKKQFANTLFKMFFC